MVKRMAFVAWVSAYSIHVDFPLRSLDSYLAKMYRGDVVIYLRSPAGTRVQLTDGATAGAAQAMACNLLRQVIGNGPAQARLAYDQFGRLMANNMGADTAQGSFNFGKFRHKQSSER
mgnify:CR=1 FL=1